MRRQQQQNHENLIPLGQNRKLQKKKKNTKNCNTFFHGRTSDRSRTRLFVCDPAGDSSHIDTVHYYVDGGTDAEHDTVAASGDNERRDPGQPGVRHGGVSVHHVVHARVLAPVQRVAQQVEVFQGWPERDRSAGHTAVLRVADTGGRDGQDGHTPVRRRAPRHTDIPHHAHTSYTQAGPALHRPAEPRVYVAQLV